MCSLQPVAVLPEKMPFNVLTMYRSEYATHMRIMLRREKEIDNSNLKTMQKRNTIYLRSPKQIFFKDVIM